MVQKSKSSTHSFPTDAAWKKIGHYPHHGVNVPLFSLRTAKSSGIGEFLDLHMLIDWCQAIGLDVIQLLPLNDTGFESSPYNAFSSSALNPVFLSLWALPYLDRYEELRANLICFRKYTHLNKVAYEAVLNAKLDYLRLYFKRTYSHFQSDPHYLEFQKKHTWLKPYALFKALKEKHAHKNWSAWHPNLRNPSKTLLARLYKEEEVRMQFYTLLQYLCFEQLKSVKQYANERGVFLKGDVPILISPESQDVWIYRKDFNLDYSAGAPPDMFSETGQNWGFPLYRWDVVEADNFSWWRTRLQIASEFYDIFRVDHIIGFYRIWGINRGDQAINGSYIPSDPWAANIQGETILKKLSSFTHMLPIGEDLGLKVEPIRKSCLGLGIPGTRIPRWEKYHDTTNDYVPLSEYPEMSLTTVSTHDSDTLGQWWRNNPKEVRKFCKFHSIEYHKNFSPTLRYELLQRAHSTPSLFHINLLQEYLGLYKELSWENIDEERINVPGTVVSSNWCYKFRPSLEEITSHQALFETMQSLVKEPSLIPRA